MVDHFCLNWKILPSSNGCKLMNYGYHFVNSRRGLGYSVLPTAVSIFGICCFRVFRVFCLFPLFSKNYWVLIMNFPVSYLLTSTIPGIALWIALKKIPRSPVDNVSK